MDRGPEMIDVATGKDDETILAILRHDPSRAWLQATEEEVYGEDDVR
jgi:hypothetical protein